MKKALTLITALFFVIGFASAQSIYFSGQANDTAKVWLNNAEILSLPDTIPTHILALQVTSNGSIQTAGFTHDTANDVLHGRIWFNDSIVFTADSNTFINKLESNGTGWIAAGIGENEWEGTKGLVWQNGELLYSYNDSIHSNQINAMAVDTLSGDIYLGGISCDPESKATIWKNDTILWVADSVSIIYDIAFDGTDLYAAGVLYSESIQATLWRNDSIILALNTDASEFDAIALYDGSIYLGGHIGNTLYIWQDSIVIYSHPFTENSTINALIVNDFGVFYAGQINGIGTVWKNGEILYQPEGCNEVSDLAVTLPPSYSLTILADTTGWGSVSGGGVFYENDTATFMAIPNIGCEFLYWNDSVTDNPRDVIILSDSTFTAYFGLIDYLMETSVDPEEGGTVTEGGIHHYGDTLTLEALPNVGYEFLYWNDSITDNPRDVIVLSDSSFTAYFGLIDYLVETSVDPEEGGTVTEGGIHHYGDTLTLEALPNVGYEFLYWNDSVIDNPRDIIVLSDSTFTAHFSLRKCNVATAVTPEGAGTVTGGGIFDYGSTTFLTAQNNTGYIFSQWSDGVTDNPREILVESDTTFMAQFTPLQYQITTAANPENGGVVEGGGIYDYGTIATLTAIPNEYYIFLCWNDGSASNPRQVTVTQDASFTALFLKNGTPEYTVTVLANDPTLGIVTGSGTYPEGSTIDIGATPYTNAYFVSWDDGSTDNPRSVSVTQDLTFTALFEMTPSYTIRVESNDTLMGTTSGSGTYFANTVINIAAIPNEGYYFAGWQDGDMNTPRLVTVTEDAVYIANFTIHPVQTYTVTVFCDENQGFVIGAGTYLEGSVARLAAIPSDGYAFVKWSDNTSDNPKEIVVDHDIVIAAFFNGTGVDEDAMQTLSLYPIPAQEKLHVKGLEGEAKISIYNSLGMVVKTSTVQGDADIAVGDLPAGVYLMRIGKRTLRFVKQ